MAPLRTRAANLQDLLSIGTIDTEKTADVEDISVTFPRVIITIKPENVKYHFFIWLSLVKTDVLSNNECSPEAGALYSDIVSGLERVADHAVNIA